MKTSQLLSATALASILVLAPTGAFAQEAPATQDSTEAATPDATQAAPADGEGTIVVTGSRIRRDGFSTAEPLTVVGKQEITQSGFISATDALQSTGVTQGSGQINNYFGGFVTDGGTGANTLGLRGLGPARTLVLLNGRRLAPGGTRGSVISADLNVLPTAIIDRIEILKAGASSIYGSDAIAGVVNIITDKKLTGVHLEAQVNVPEVGAGVDTRISAAFGFQNDRLNVIGSAEYRKRNQLSLADVPFFSCPIGGFLSGEGTPFGSGDAFPVGDPRNCFTLDNGGVTINTLGLPTRAAIGRTSGTVGNYNRFVPSPGTTTGPFPGYLGVGTYDRDTFDPDSQKQALVNGEEVYTGYLSATYQVGGLGNAELYGEVLATRRNSSAPLYRQLALDYLTGSPLLPANIRNGVFSNPVNTSSGHTVAARAFIGYGLTDSTQQVDYVRASAGIRGDFFFKDWRYDAYVGKSWNDGTYEIESFLIDRLANSLDVVDNGNGTFSCRSQAANPTCVAAPALSAAVINGSGLSPAYRDYIVDNTIGHTQFRETTFSFNVDGPIFHLPGGDAQMSLGAEYRKQSIDDEPDANSINGNLLGLTAGTPTVGRDNVKEVFGELYLPLLSDKPFFYRLNVDGSVRYTDYASYGSDTTFKVGGEWEPIHGFAFRGSYGTSYRAPALAEQFLGATSGFLGADSDPCTDLPAPASQSPTQQVVATNCASIGLPANFHQTNGITVFQVGGAQAGLKAETSKNWTVGAVARPDLGSIGQLSLSVDYFNIKVSNGVSALDGGAILNRCYSDKNFNPSAGFCRFVTRDANSGLSVVSSYVNLSEDIVKGYEFNARYANNIFGGRFVLNGRVTHYTEQSSRLFPEEYLTDANGTLTQPDWVGNFDASYTFDNVTLRYGVDWIDGDRDKTYEYLAFNNLTGQTDPADVQFYRDNTYNEASSYFLHAASVQINVAQSYQFTFGVRNLFNTAPPRVTAYAYSTIGNAPLYSGYDYVGRTFFANVNFKF